MNHQSQINATIAKQQQQNQITMSNLPDFFSINPDGFVKELDNLLNKQRQQISALAKIEHKTWQNFMLPLDEMDDKLEKFFSPLSHLHAVSNTKSLRDAYQGAIPLMSAFATEIGQNEELFNAIKTIETSNPIEEKIKEDELLSFKLAGVSLNEKDKARFKAIQEKLAKLSNQFENNLLDATNNWRHVITLEKDLKGLPEHAIETAFSLSDKENEWVLTLEFPCFHAVMTFAEDEALRQKMYHAFVTRASQISNEDLDNNPIIAEILKLRFEKARLLGFDNYAQLSLAKKMLKSTDDVTNFLEDLAKKVLPQAKDDYLALEAFAGKTLNAWDIGFYSEKMRQAKYEASQEDFRPYFPEEKVISGLFDLTHNLYDITFSEVDDFPKYHPNIRLFRLQDSQDNDIGYLYMDLFARAHKRGGAWMNDYCSYRKKEDGEYQKPVAFITCNFAPPTKDGAYFSHDEILTLFHEFGHALHHLLTKVEYLSCSGINGVEWDAVELPSQFLENFAYDRTILNKLSCHKKTGEALPDEMIDKLINAKNFQSAMGMLRQLEFSIFDFSLHQDYNPDAPKSAYDVLSSIREKYSVVPYPSYNQFPCGFSHIFAGGYAAGYYSYKWAEVLSSDAFSRFEEEGIFNPECGNAFLKEILEVGGSRPAMESFVAFRGRKPTIDALLAHNGINR